MYKELIEQVKRLATEAALIIDEIAGPKVTEKGKNDFVTEVDIKISEFLCARLPGLLADSSVISEEGNKVLPDDGYYWIVDPVDGTSNFIYGFPEFAISIGLIKDKKAVLGVIYAPKMGELYYAAKGMGAFCNGKPIHVSQDERVESTLVLSETNPYSEDRLANRIFPVYRELLRDCIDLRITGSAALDCCYIACGRGGVFVAENLKPWDYAAGEIIICEAGGKVTQWDGQPLTYYGDSTVLAANNLVYDEVRQRLRLCR